MQPHFIKLEPPYQIFITEELWKINVRQVTGPCFISS